jgi:hypothetical protein
MITIQLADSNPQPFGSGLAIKLKGDSLPEIQIRSVSDICYCDLECEYVMCSLKLEENLTRMTKHHLCLEDSCLAIR